MCGNRSSDKPKWSAVLRSGIVRADILSSRVFLLARQIFPLLHSKSMNGSALKKTAKLFWQNKLWSHGWSVKSSGQWISQENICGLDNSLFLGKIFVTWIQYLAALRHEAAWPHYHITNHNTKGIIRLALKRLICVLKWLTRGQFWLGAPYIKRK